MSIFKIRSDFTLNNFPTTLMWWNWNAKNYWVWAGDIVQMVGTYLPCTQGTCVQFLASMLNPLHPKNF